jgi:3D (Asp-Asp-Asp) domain-containing protein
MTTWTKILGAFVMIAVFLAWWVFPRPPVQTKSLIPSPTSEPAGVPIFPEPGRRSSETQAGEEPAVTYRVSAYCPCSRCCGKWADGITASGKPAVGLCIAAPPEIPFGSLVTVPGYGTAPVLDRGGAIRGLRMDVLFPTHEAALAWGVRYLPCVVHSPTPQEAGR